MRIGGAELLVILLMAYLLLGPEKTVVYAVKAGKWIRTMKIYISSITEDLTETVEEPLNELKQPLQELEKPMNILAAELETSAQELSRQISAEKEMR